MKNNIFRRMTALLLVVLMVISMIPSALADTVSNSIGRFTLSTTSGESTLQLLNSSGYNASPLVVEGTVQLFPTLTPEDSSVTYTYVSDNTEVATVNANGKVKAVYVGEATITATASNGLTAQHRIIVNASATEIIQVVGETYLKDGTSTILQGLLNKKEMDINWSIKSGEEFVSIAADTSNTSNSTWNLQVTAKAIGTAVITATTADGEASKDHTIIVTKAAPVAVKVFMYNTNRQLDSKWISLPANGEEFNLSQFGPARVTVTESSDRNPGVTENIGNLGSYVNNGIIRYVDEYQTEKIKDADKYAKNAIVSKVRVSTQGAIEVYQSDT